MRLGVLSRVDAAQITCEVECETNIPCSVVGLEARLELVNQVLKTGRTQYGPGFADTMNAHLPQPLREVEVLYLRPSRDLGRVAAEVWDASAIQANRATRMLLSTIADRATDGESDLLSYLLFDRIFSDAIEALGYADAQARSEEIAAFLRSATGSTT